MMVRSTHVATYASPIAGGAKDPVAVGHEGPEQPGWWWCCGPYGREGWIHESFLDRHGMTSRLARQYDAMELSVEPGQGVEVDEVVGGWAWCRTTDGRSGWVPVSVLSAADAASGSRG